MDISCCVPLPPPQNYPHDFLLKKTNNHRIIRKIRFINKIDSIVTLNDDESIIFPETTQ
jgi:hypothetical protein